MKPLTELQMPLIPAASGLPPEIARFPRFRYMGSKFRLLPWIHETLAGIDRLFRHFADSIQVLSYSSNAYPDLETLRALMGRYKKSVEVLEKEHRYHFGTHSAAKRNVVQEYLLIGS